MPQIGAAGAAALIASALGGVATGAISASQAKKQRKAQQDIVNQQIAAQKEAAEAERKFTTEQRDVNVTAPKEGGFGFEGLEDITDDDLLNSGRARQRFGLDPLNLDFASKPVVFPGNRRRRI